MARNAARAASVAPIATAPSGAATAATSSAARRAALQSPRPLGRRDRGFAARRLSFRLGGDLVAQSEDFLDQRALPRPVGFDRREPLALLDETRVDLGDALFVGGAEIAFARQRLLLAFQRRDRDLGVLDRGRLGVLADRDARAGGVEQAHRLVRQLPRGDVAMGEIHRGDDRLVGDAHLVVLLHRSDEAAQHHRGGGDVGLADVDRLEAPRQRGVLLEILPIFGPGRRRDGAQRAARERRLEQVGRVARARRAARADQRVGFVDEQDDRRRRGLHFVDDRAQTLLEFALHRGAGLHQADVERAAA